jgi:tetratricopeptide (TPR) repeat protein
VAEEAVSHHRTLAAAHPDAFTADLAASLNNLANRLSDLARREDALMVAEEAVRLRRALAAVHPEAFTPDLALSLNNLAAILSTLRRREEALAAAEEAVRLRRALAAARPDAFGVDLARSVWVLGDLYGETGKSDLAVGTLTEGLRLLTPIFVAVPAAVAGIMVGLVQSYLAQCEAAGREPDDELLRPAAAVFERLNAIEIERLMLSRPCLRRGLRTPEKRLRNEGTSPRRKSTGRQSAIAMTPRRAIFCAA